MDSMDGRAQRLVELFEDAISDELRVAAGVSQIALSEEQIKSLSHAVSSRLLYAFSIEWAPDWVPAGSVHSWESSDGYRTLCRICLRESPAAKDSAEADGWAQDHQRSHGVEVTAL